MNYNPSESRQYHQEWFGLNATFLTLVPKPNVTNEPCGFRPISLCNIIYKIISSILVHLLKPSLHHIISPE